MMTPERRRRRRDAPLSKAQALLLASASLPARALLEPPATAPAAFALTHRHRRRALTLSVLGRAAAVASLAVHTVCGLPAGRSSNAAFARTARLRTLGRLSALGAGAAVDRAALGREVEVLPSPGKGMGVFAKQPIRAGSLLEYYQGEVITKARFEQLYNAAPCDTLDEACLIEERRAGGLRTGAYCFDVGAGYSIDAEDKARANWTRYMNHSELRPNVEPFVEGAGATARVRFDSIADIPAGAELLFNYGDDFFATRDFVEVAGD